MSAFAGTLSAQMAPAVQALLWVAALIVVAIAAFVVMGWLRGRWLGADGRAADAGPMSLEQIRKMHREGAITDAERDALRAQTLALAGAPARAAPVDGSKGESAAIRRAPPGYDLTGEPLPQLAQGRSSDTGGSSDDASAQESEGTQGGSRRFG